MDMCIGDGNKVCLWDYGSDWATGICLQTLVLDCKMMVLHLGKFCMSGSGWCRCALFEYFVRLWEPPLGGDSLKKKPVSSGDAMVSWWCILEVCFGSKRNGLEKIWARVYPGKGEDAKWGKGIACGVKNQFYVGFEMWEKGGKDVHENLQVERFPS